MLALLFNIGAERFGLDASDIIEVVPLVEIAPPPAGQDFLAGEFSYRGSPTPVIDLGRLTGQPPCPLLLSTRIILVRHGVNKETARVIGLLAEKVTETVRITAAQLNTTEQQLDETAFRTPITLDSVGTVQLLHLDRLLPPAVLDMLLSS